MWYLWVTYQSAGDGSLSNSRAGAAPQLSITTALRSMHSMLTAEFGAVGFLSDELSVFVMSEKLMGGASGRTVTVQSSSQQRDEKLSFSFIFCKRAGSLSTLIVC